MRRYFGKETILYLTALVLCVLAFVLLGSTGAGIAAAMLILYGAFSAVMTFGAGRNLTVRLTAQGEQEKGRPARAALLIRSRGRLPVFRCDAVLTAENVLTGIRRTTKLVSGIAPGKAKVCEFTAGDGCCGVLKLSLSALRIGDPLLILSREVRAEEAEAEILIRPEIRPAAIRTDLLDQYDMESFRYADNRVGTDTSETVSIREYTDGDSMRSIHWKLSAKADSLLVREPGFPVDNRLMVIADKRLPGESAPQTDENAVQDHKTTGMEAEGKTAGRENENRDSIRESDHKAPDRKAGNRQETGKPDDKTAENTMRERRLALISEMTEAALAVSATLAERGIRHQFGWFDCSVDTWQTEDVAGPEDVYRLLHAFLCAPAGPDEMDAAERFISSGTEKIFSTYLLVTPAAEDCEAGILRLREYGYVTVYRTEEYTQKEE